MAIKKGYLIFYNSVTTLLWARLLFITVWTLLSFPASSVVDRARHVHEPIGLSLQWTQALAMLEVVHAALGIIRSSIFATALQVFSRVAIAFYVLYGYPPVATSATVATLVIAWSTAEIVRCTYYIFGLLGGKNYVLTWIRYSMFIPLYPLGVGSEMWLLYLSLPYAQAKWGIPGAVGTWAALAAYIPGWPFLLRYMWYQRAKVLRRDSVKKE